jgi:photosystem II stability/assembly factor-like uncharacterized protein
MNLEFLNDIIEIANSHSFSSILVKILKKELTVRRVKMAKIYTGGMRTLCLGIITYSYFGFSGLLHAQVWEVRKGPNNIKDIKCIIFVDTTIYACGKIMGIQRSSDNGKSWTDLNRLGCCCLAFNGVYLFAGTENQVFTSNDFGLTWFHSSDGIENLYAYNFAVNGTDIYVGTAKGVYISTNSGTLWKRADAGISDQYIYTLHTHKDIVFAGVNNGIYRSVDTGKIWTQTLTGTSIHSMFSSGEQIFAGGWNGIFRSTTNGETWRMVDSTFKNYPITGFAGFGKSLLGAVRDHEILVSSDSGMTWLPGNSPVDIMCLAQRNSDLFAGTSTNGVFYSPDTGKSWSALSKQVLQFSPLAFASTPSGIFVGTKSEGVFMSGDSGASWSQVNSGLTNTSISAFVAADTVLVAGTRAEVFLSKNSGKSWSRIGFWISEPYISALAVKDGYIFAGTAGPNGVYRSTNEGATWTDVNTGLTDKYVRALTVNGNEIFLATVGGVFRSSDNGLSWTNIAPQSSLINLKALSFAGTDLLIASESEGIFHYSTLDGSCTLNKGLKTSHLTASGSMFFASTAGGVSVSTNSGASWVAINEGLPKSNISALKAIDGYLYAGTEDGCVSRIKITDIPVNFIPRSSNKVTGLTLHVTQCGSYEQISYTIPRSCPVSLKVYSLSGKLQLSLPQGFQTYGTHTLSFKKNDELNQLSILDFQAGSYSMRIKIITLK